MLPDWIADPLDTLTLTAALRSVWRVRQDRREWSRLRERPALFLFALLVAPVCGIAAGLRPGVVVEYDDGGFKYLTGGRLIGNGIPYNAA